MPRRIQLRRARGWRKPPDAIVIARPGAFGNPFRAGDRAPDGTMIIDRADAVRRYREWIGDTGEPFAAERDTVLRRIDELRGHDLACWCPTDGPCHGDVLLVLAEGTTAPT